MAASLKAAIRALTLTCLGHKRVSARNSKWHFGKARLGASFKREHSYYMTVEATEVLYL